MPTSLDKGIAISAVIVKGHVQRYGVTPAGKPGTFEQSAQMSPRFSAIRICAIIAIAKDMAYDDARKYVVIVVGHKDTSPEIAESLGLPRL